MTPLPFELERLSAARAALVPRVADAGQRLLATAARALEAELGAPVAATATALPGTPPVAADSVELLFDLGAFGEQVVLEVDAALAAALAAMLLGAGDPPGAPATRALPGERAALELLSLVALSGTRDDACCVALAPRLVRERTPCHGALVIDLAITAAGIRGGARARIPAAAVAAVARVCATTPAVVPHIAIAGRLRRGTVTLGADEARSIARGDVVLLDDGSAGRDVLVFDGGAELVGRVDGEVFTVEDRTMQDWNGNFPVAISVEIARVTVALRDLAGVDVGSTVPLAIPRDGSVTLRSGDVVVGRGELVEIDGALGVRVASWEGCR